MNDTNLRSELERILAPEFVLERELAHPGGISAFSARDTRNGAPATVKAVSGGVLSGSDTLGAATLDVRGLPHANVVPIVEAARGEGVFYWISPAVEGRSLRSRMARGTRVELRDAIAILRDVAAALAHAHGHGVIHGGLSPDNILITGGAAVVADLGLTGIFSGLRAPNAMQTQGGDAAAVIAYAAPEQSSAGRSDARSDVYGWGVIAYELLSGRHPFAGRTSPREIMAAHMGEKPTRLETSRFNVPQTVTRLVMRCLEKDPAKRPDSAREIYATLTGQMLTPRKPDPAGTGQKLVIALALLIVATMLAVALMPR